MKKKLLSVLLATTMLTSSLPCSVFGQAQEEKIEIEETEDFGLYLEDYVSKISSTEKILGSYNDFAKVDLQSGDFSDFGEAYTEDEAIQLSSQATTEITLTIGKAEIIIDGRSKALDVPPVVVDNEVLVPARAIFEALGASVAWNDTTKTIEATKDDTTVKLTIGNSFITVNGVDHSIPVPAQIIDSRTMVPAKAISEAFGYYVYFNSSTGVMTITDSDIRYNISGRCGENLTWLLDTDGTLTISGTGNMWNWNSASETPWYLYRKFIKKVTFETNVTFYYGDKSFTTVWRAGDTITIPYLPDDAVIPDGKIFVGWTAGNQTYYAGGEHLFTGDYCEFTAEFVDRGSVTFDFKALYPEGVRVISGFEPPYAYDGNYTINGVKTEVTTFDGQSVKAFSKTADKITATREKAPTTKEDYSLNLYGYGRQYDSAGNAISMLDASYVSVEYYYDTTMRDTSDANGQEIAGKRMVYSQENINGSWAGVSASSQPIVANSWQKAVIALKDSPKAGSYFDPAKENDYYMDSFKLYLFGEDRGLQMYKGDVFYVKSIMFTKFDTSTLPSTSRQAAVYLYENDTEALYEAKGLKDFDRFTLPEVINPGETVVKEDGVVYIDLNEYDIGDLRFANWIRSGYGTKHEPGEVIKLNNLDDAIFYMNLVSPQEVKFVYDDKSFSEYWFENSEVVFPALPDDAVIPEGKLFAGWEADGVKYAAGEKYTFTGELLELTAVYSDPFAVYYSSAGAIDGISDTVYTSLADADAALAAEGGVGTIYVSGNLELSHTQSFNSITYTFTSTDVKIVGYDDDATVTFTKSGDVVLESASRTKLTFDDIEIVRGKGATDEFWLNIKNIDLVFGDNCGFTSATFNDWMGNPVQIGLYIANGYNNSVEIGGDVYVDSLSPIGGWTGSSHTATSDYKFVVNGGNVHDIFLICNNGNYNAQQSVVTGNVEVEVNSGNIARLFLGSNRADKLDGNAVVTINGGNINGIYYGIIDSYAWVSTGYIKNLAIVYNIKEILANNSGVTYITKANNGITVQNSVVVVNNAELLANVPTLDIADYNVQVKGGKATPIFDGNNVYFNITIDSTDEGSLFANGKIIEAGVDGLYTLEKGTTVIEHCPADQLVTVKFDDNTEEQVLAGANYQLPTIGTDSGNEYFYGWMVDGKFFAGGSSFTLPATDGSVVNVTTKRVSANDVIYLDTSSGNDTNDGLSSSSPLKTVSEVNKRLQAFKNGNATLEIIDTLSDTYLDLPTYSGVLTITGGTIKWNGGLNLNSDTVFKNVSLYATGDYQYINTGVYDLTFDEGVTKASNSKDLYIHAGVQNSNMNGDIKVVLKSGNIKDFRVGPYYNDTGSTKTWNGNFELIVDGATLGMVEHGDSWGSTTEGTFVINGTEKIIIKSGSVGYMNTHKLAAISGGIYVYDYCNLSFEFNNWDPSRISINRFNMNDDENPVALSTIGFTTGEPENITSIGSYAFSELSNLVSAYIPDYVTFIGNSAFSGCTKLEKVVVLSKDVEYGSDAFYGCSNLILRGYTDSTTQSYAKENDIPFIPLDKEILFFDKCGDNLICILDAEGTLTISGKGDMWYNLQAPWYSHRTSIKNVVINSGVTSICSYAFYQCTELESITIPDGVTHIGSLAFSCCSKLKNITLPDSLTSIGAAFGWCYSLERVEIPKNVSTIIENAFYCCTGIKEFVVAQDNEYYMNDEFGALYTKSKSALVQYPIGRTETSYTVPSGVITICGGAFGHSDILTSVILPDSVMIINNEAFHSCHNLKEITLGAGVSYIYGYTFNYCENLETVYYNGLESWWNQIEIADGNSALTNANIVFNFVPLTGECGDNLTWILDAEGTLTISGTGEMWNWDYLENNFAPWYSYRQFIRKVIIEDGVTTIGNEAFLYCTNLVSIEIPDSVTAIGSGAFVSCVGLTGIEIPDSVTSIYEYAFHNCTSLTSINIPDSVTSIGEYAFKYCSSLKTLHIGSGLETLGYWALEYCHNLESIVVDEENPFYSSEDGILFNKNKTDIIKYPENKSGGSYIIPNSVTNIVYDAFFNCDNLKKVTIPNSVTSIGDAAFYDCNNLSTTYYMGTQQEWGKIKIGAYNDPLIDSDIIFLNQEDLVPFEGAQIRTEGKQGLRFVFTIPKDLAESSIEYGSVVMPKVYLGDKPLEIGTENTINGKKYKAKKVPAVKLFKETEDEIQFTVCITDIKKSNYAREYMAVSYLTYEKDGEIITVYGEETQNISINSIAEMMYEDKNTSEELKEYLYENILSLIPPKDDFFDENADYAIILEDTVNVLSKIVDGEYKELYFVKVVVDGAVKWVPLAETAKVFNKYDEYGEITESNLNKVSLQEIKTEAQAKAVASELKGKFSFFSKTYDGSAYIFTATAFNEADKVDAAELFADTENEHAVFFETDSVKITHFTDSIYKIEGINSFPKFVVKPYSKLIIKSYDEVADEDLYTVYDMFDLYFDELNLRNVKSVFINNPKSNIENLGILYAESDKVLSNTAVEEYRIVIGYTIINTADKTFIECYLLDIKDGTIYGIAADNDEEYPVGTFVILNDEGKISGAADVTTTYTRNKLFMGEFTSYDEANKLLTIGATTYEVAADATVLVYIDEETYFIPEENVLTEEAEEIAYEELENPLGPYCDTVLEIYAVATDGEFDGDLPVINTIVVTLGSFEN